MAFHAMEFHATVDIDPKTAMGITLPGEVIDALGAGKRSSVLVSINGYAFSTTIGSMGGAFRIPVWARPKSIGSLAISSHFRINR